MSSGKPTKFPTQLVNGWPFPGTVVFDVQNIKDAIGMKLRSDDLVVATYPKCGTNWMMYIVWSILNDGQLPLPDQKTLGFKLIPFLEATGPKMADDLPSPRTLMTHLPYHLTPKSPNAKYIFVTRNPRDCVVSYYHFSRQFFDETYSQVTFSDFFDQFMSKDAHYGDYFDHLLGWYKHKDDPNMLLITFEDMLADPSGAVLKVAKFMGTHHETKVTANNNELLNKVVKNTSFGHMKSSVKAFESPEKPVLDFFRKGVSGDWLNYFSEDQVKRMDKRIEERQCRQLMTTLFPGTF